MQWGQEFGIIKCDFCGIRDATIDLKNGHTPDIYSCCDICATEYDRCINCKDAVKDPYNDKCFWCLEIESSEPEDSDFWDNLD